MYNWTFARPKSMAQHQDTNIPIIFLVSHSVSSNVLEYSAQNKHYSFHAFLFSVIALQNQCSYFPSFIFSPFSSFFIVIFSFRFRSLFFTHCKLCNTICISTRIICSLTRLIVRFADSTHLEALLCFVDCI